MAYYFKWGTLEVAKMLRQYEIKKDPYSLCHTGYIYYCKKRYMESARSYEKSDNMLAMVQLYTVYKKLGMVADAVSLLKSGVKLKNSYAMVKLANHHHYNNRYDLAVSLYQQAIELDGNIEAINKLAELYTSSGSKSKDKERGIKLYHRAIKSGHPYAHNNLIVQINSNSAIKDIYLDNSINDVIRYGKLEEELRLAKLPCKKCKLLCTKCKDKDIEIEELKEEIFHLKYRPPMGRSHVRPGYRPYRGGFSRR